MTYFAHFQIVIHIFNEVLPYTTLTNTWTCYWEENGPHWEEMDEAELEHFPTTIK